MEKFKIEFKGKSYDAVEINGACVSDKDFSYDFLRKIRIKKNK